MIPLAQMPVRPMRATATVERTQTTKVTIRKPADLLLF